MVYFDRSTGCWVCFCPKIFSYSIKVTKSLGINEKYSWYLKKYICPETCLRESHSPSVNCRFGLICLGQQPLRKHSSLLFPRIRSQPELSQCTSTISPLTVIRYKSLHFQGRLSGTCLWLSPAHSEMCSEKSIQHALLLPPSYSFQQTVLGATFLPWPVLFIFSVQQHCLPLDQTLTLDASQ